MTKHCTFVHLDVDFQMKNKDDKFNKSKTKNKTLSCFFPSNHVRVSTSINVQFQLFIFNQSY